MRCSSASRRSRARSCSSPQSPRRSTSGRERVPLAEGVIEHLRERRLLLVLDNFEQLLDAAPFVAELLAAAPRLWILATSRAPLRLAAEREYPVPPFDTPDAGLPFEALVETDALRLFAARARAVDPTFELDGTSAAGGRTRLRPARRAAARDRAGGRAREAARAGGDPGAARARAAPAPERPARRAGPPAHARRHDPLEL